MVVRGVRAPASPFSQNRSRDLAVASVIGVLIALSMMLAHTMHIPEPGSSHDLRRNAHPSPAMSDPPASVTTALLVGDHDGADCPAPRWVAQRMEPLADPAPATFLVSTLLSPSNSPADIQFTRLACPIPTGPDRQALLQRFTL